MDDRENDIKSFNDEDDDDYEMDSFLDELEREDDVRMSCIFSMCIDCKNFLDSKKENGEYKFTCSAFPDGIPQSVFWHKTDETEECSEGIRFDPIDCSVYSDKEDGLR